jgi:hypothetical protein
MGGGSGTGPVVAVGPDKHNAVLDGEVDDLLFLADV